MIHIMQHGEALSKEEDPERPLTGRIAASSYNNYYEFINQGKIFYV